jgi:uncharacterized protein (DUF58 family)
MANLARRLLAAAQARTREPPGNLRLERQRIFILPTRAGLGVAASCAILWVGAVNFNLQLGYLLAFVVAALALASMVQAHRNLLHLVLRAQDAAAVHAGEVARFGFVLENPGGPARYAINLCFVVPRRRREGSLREARTRGVWVDVAPAGAAPVSLGLPTRRRGLRPCPRLRISSRFPYGLWEAWAYARPTLEAVVYPAPEPGAPALPPGTGADRPLPAGAAGEGEDIAGVRPYRVGDPLKHVAWRLSARDESLSVRIYDSSAGEFIRLAWSTLPAGLGHELRIARLARWVLDAEAGGLRYSLELPGSEAIAGTGPGQRHRCLEALARLPAR